MIVGMTSSLSRRRLLSHAVAAAGMGLLATGAATTRAAAAAQPSGQAPPVLPTIGQQFTLSCVGFGATLVVNLPPPLPALNFIGSRVVRAEVGDADFVRLRTLNFAMDAVHPLFGRVTLRLPDIDSSPDSLLQLTPDGLVETWTQSMALTFERSGEVEGPFSHETLEPGKWIANHIVFPPPPQERNPDGSSAGGTRYVLQAPIKYGHDSTEAGQLRGFDINQGVIPG
ncbi:hypothetical protein [Streptomyces sp. NPDC048481]|uniref:hypothetical protein n=1 Tax=Streptomyces sp. NPDC048481 TaxID=3365557 RepID=UPI00372349FA